MKRTLHFVAMTLMITGVAVPAASGQGLSSGQIDSIVKSSMEMMPQAGVAVAVVKDGKVIHNRGYGVTSVATGERVDEHTLFSIASNSKAFTAAALAILVDEGKLSWDDRVVDHLPGFRMYDPYVTENFNIADLLTHRSGLGLGAGDLMIFPDGSDFTIGEVMRSFQFMEPVSAFRTKYDYDNLLYIVAGEIIARISGMPWQTFIETRIMEPLGMERSVGAYGNLKDKTNVAMPHASENGELKLIAPYAGDVFNGAAGVNASVNDLSKWLLVQLNGGRYGDKLEKRLFSEESQAEMWRIHTIIDSYAKGDPRYRSHFEGYGLGWSLKDYNGYFVARHTGGLPGMLSKTLIVPELALGIVVLTNTDPGGYTFNMLPQAIMDSYIGVPAMDWTAYAFNLIETGQNNADSVLNAVWTTVEQAAGGDIDPGNYTGTYADDWFGKVEIFRDKSGERLLIRSLRSPKLTGEMFFYKATTFAIKWEYTDMNCDAFATFSLDREGKATGIKMEGISPLIDFSFDFHDLDLRRVEN
jgi:CubicO group peptidase (beta-lactamase class C family)